MRRLMVQPGYAEALTRAGLKYPMKRSPSTQHGFNIDTTPRNDPAVAKEAWGEAMALSNPTLRT